MILDNFWTTFAHDFEAVAGSCLPSFVHSGVSRRDERPKYHGVLLRINKDLAGVITVWILILLLKYHCTVWCCISKYNSYYNAGS
ncbi:hypothetical protein VNO77_22439 [Canavalia gladiata]|uniref:Uncharacterized protein n=1 Tax=Canavalia gladiata TaxID=3824 RepID=A0AAN9L2L3_CANGL